MSKKKHTYSVNVGICINDDFLVKADFIREAKLLASEKFKKKFLKEKNFELDEMEILYFQFLLLRYWFRNKNKEEVFVFEPINIRNLDTEPFYIDAIKYDTSPRDHYSLNVLESIASDDKLLFRIHGKEKFFSSPCLKKHEIKKLILRLNQIYGPSLTKNKMEDRALAAIDHIEFGYFDDEE